MKSPGAGTGKLDHVEALKMMDWIDAPQAALRIKVLR